MHDIIIKYRVIYKIYKYNTKYPTIKLNTLNILLHKNVQNAYNIKLLLFDRKV